MCIYKTYTIINTEREKMKLKNFKTAKDIFAKTYNRKMFDFMERYRS